MPGPVLAPRRAAPSAPVRASVGTPGRSGTEWMDLARVTGMVAVVIAHVFAPAIRFDLTDRSSPAWWAAAAISAASRFSVPLFLIISGALLLAPAAGRRPMDFYRRRLDRIAIPLVVWCAFYLALRYFTADDGLSGVEALREILSGGVYYHLYFLFVLAGLYALTPFLRVIVLNSSERMLRAFAIVLLAIGALNQAAVVLLGTGQGNAATQFLPYLGYFVGGLLVARAPLSRRLVRVGAAAVLAGITLTTVGGWALSVGLGPVYVEYVLLPLSPSVMLTAFGAVILFRAAPLHAPRLTGSALIARLSALSFGIYLVHPAVLTQIRGRVTFPPEVGAMVATGVAILVVTLAVAAAITALGHCVPGLRRAF